MVSALFNIFRNTLDCVTSSYPKSQLHTRYSTISDVFHYKWNIAMIFKHIHTYKYRVHVFTVDKHSSSYMDSRVEGTNCLISH